MSDSVTKGTAENAAPEVPISAERLHGCLHSAERWSQLLPQFADCWQKKADFWAILAGILAALAGSAIFSSVGANSTWVKSIMSVVALASAICALVPRVKGYAEEAGAARILAAHYGSIYGRLLDLVQQNPVNERAAQAAVAEFQAVKEKKDLLRGLATWKFRRPAPPDAAKPNTPPATVVEADPVHCPPTPLALSPST
jgi:hypothetical protein